MVSKFRKLEKKWQKTLTLRVFLKKTFQDKRSAINRSLLDILPTLKILIVKAPREYDNS